MVRTDTISTKGFTLVELMVVIAIIGLLAAVGIPKMLVFLNDAKAAEAVSSLGKVANIMDAKSSILNNWPGAGTTYNEINFAANNMAEADVSSSKNFTYAVNAGANIAAGFCLAARSVNTGWTMTTNNRCIYYSSIVPATAAGLAVFDASGHFYKTAFTADVAVSAEVATANPLCTAALCTTAPTTVNANGVVKP
jgi:prepilin-type N-terminal cleavage/methylation domain-containing protein